MNITKVINQTWGKLDESWRFAITAFIVARVFFAIWSWVILTVQPIAVHYIGETNNPGVVFLDLYTSQTYAYSRTVDGSHLTFRPVNRTTVTDLQSNSLWDISNGIAIEGKYKDFKLSPTSYPSDLFEYVGTIPYHNTWLALWQRFDANWYISIAETGYLGNLGTEHFPPFYPLLIRLTMPIFSNAFIAGLVISHLTTLLAIKLLFDLFNQWNNTTSRQAVLYFLIFPSSFFLFSVYSESLFIVLALLALRSMKKQHWAWAGFWVFCATLTRLQGVALGVPLLYSIWQDRPFLRKFHHWAGLGVSGTGILFFFYLRSVISTDSVIPVTESAWPARLAPPWEAYGYAIQTLLSNKYNYIDLLNLVVTTLMIILLATGWRKIPPEYNLYTAFSLFVMTARIVEPQPLSGMLRFSLTLFPVFYIISFAGNNPWWRRVIIYTCIALNLYLSAEFFGWGWVA